MTISLVVPIYNEAPFLPRCFQSIENQTITFDEVILIDDGSEDTSAQIASEYAERNGWRIIISDKNYGVGNSRNLGIRASKSDYITFLDSDDRLYSSACEAIHNAIEMHQDAEIIQFDHTRIVNGAEPAKPNEERFYDFRKGIKNAPSFWCYVWNKAYKRNLIKNYRFGKLSFGEDEAFNLELLLQGHRIYCDRGETVIKHFDNANSLAHLKSYADIKAQDEHLNSLLTHYHEPWQQKAIRELIDDHRASKTYKTMGWK